MLNPSARVRKSAQFIANSPYTEVIVDPYACDEAANFVANILNHKSYTYQSISDSWLGSGGLHPTSLNSQTLHWIFVVDTLNFCFWSEPHSQPFTVCYKNNNYTGYWALCAAINRAIDEDIPITNPSFYSTVDLTTLKYIFRSETKTPISLLEQRVQVLNQAGTILQQKFQGDVQNLISTADGSAQKLIQLVVSNFKSYDDSVPLANYPFLKDGLSPQLDLPALCFYKRAQILVADIWASFAATKLYRFKDISELTMFADYRVPQILNWLGAIKYSDKLMQKLKCGDQLISGSKDEIEIRACSIYAVELIRKQLDPLMKSTSQSTEEGVSVNSVLIDFALWDYAKAHHKKLANVPIHLVKSIFY